MLFLQIWYVLAYISLCVTQAPVTVNTNVGNIMGFQEFISVDGEQKLISKFLGIPYAESTAGANRFRKPVPKAPFQGPFDARKTPAACYQQSVQDTTLLKGYGVHAFSEDCLTLNIYVPHELRSNNMLPVMIWIYGGGFINGAASLYNPEVLSIIGNVIVVTVNYRLGMFGFLRDKNGIFPGNQGLWDQHLAIKWVHENIESFFGYKDEITIFGQSAGGASVLLQAIYPGNKGLFKRVIAESGAAISPWVIKDASSFDVYFSNQGCAPDSKTFVTCLQLKSPLLLQSNLTQFGPVVDEDFLIALPEEILYGNSTKIVGARNYFASLDILVGTNSEDGTGFLTYLSSIDLNISKNEFKDKIVPAIVNLTFLQAENVVKATLEKLMTFFYTDWTDPDDFITLRRNVADLSNDAYYFAPAIRTARAHVKLNSGKTYFYEFAVQVQKHFIPVPPWIKGSVHVDEVSFVLGTPLLRNTSMFGVEHMDYTSEEKQVSRATMAMWSNFAKSGNPNLPMDVAVYTNATWPEYDLTSQRYFQIGNQMSQASVKQRFYPRRMAFWSDIVPDVVKQRSC